VERNFSIGHLNFKENDILLWMSSTVRLGFVKTNCAVLERLIDIKKLLLLQIELNFSLL
jgi:hypothetical protein